MLRSAESRLVLLLSLCQFLAWGSGFYVFACVIEAVERDINLTRMQSGLAFSAALLMEGLAGYFVGRLIDEGRARAVMAGGSILLATGLYLQSAADSLLGFLVACGVTGAGFAGSLYAPAFAVLTRYLPRDYRSATTKVTLLAGLASTVFIPICSILTEEIGWRATLQVMAAINLLICAPMLWKILVCSNEPRSLARSDASSSRVFRKPAFWWAACFGTLVTTVAAAIPPHLLAMVREAGCPPTWSPWLCAVFGVAQCLSRLAFLGSTTTTGARASEVWLVWIVPASLATYLLAGGFWMLLVFMVLYGAGSGVITIVRGIVVADYVDRSGIGAINGLINVPASLGRVAAPWILAALWGTFGTYKIGVACLFAMSCIGAWAFSMVYKTSGGSLDAKD